LVLSYHSWIIAGRCGCSRGSTFDFPVLQFLFLISLLAVSLLFFIQFHCLWSVFDDICVLNFLVVWLTLYHHPIFLILCKCIVFYQTLFAAYEIMVFMFLHFKTILLLSVISWSVWFFLKWPSYAFAVE
jgi:hypothetical protein